MTSLLDIIKATFSRELVSHMASRLGEAEAGVSKALSGLVPVVLAGLIKKAGAGEAQLVYDLSQNACRTAIGHCGSMTGLLGIAGSGDSMGGTMMQGECLLILLFGASTGTIAESISEYAGIKPDSAKTLLGTAGVVVPALLGQYASSYHLRAKGTAWLLMGLKGQVRKLLPAGLHGLMGLLRLGRLGNWAVPVASGRLAPVRAQPAIAGRLKSRWSQLLVTFVGFVMVRYCLLVWSLPAADVASSAGGLRASTGPITAGRVGGVTATVGSRV